MITKAIIPVAGWGTRRLPITKSIEKCMLPIGDTPAIDFVVQDCIKAGITDIYFVVNGNATQLRTYYSRLDELEEYLKRNKKEAMLPLIMPPAGVEFHFVIQDTNDGRYGTTIPAWLCRQYVDKGEQVLVIMGDQFFYRTDGGSNAADLIKKVTGSGASCGLLGVPVPEEDVQQYGIIERDEAGNYIRIFEHPTPEQAPGNLNNASFYLFDSLMFEYFDRDIDRPHDREYFIIDPINEYVKDGNPVKVFEAVGEYCDIGNVNGWLRANQMILAKGGQSGSIHP